MDDIIRRIVEAAKPEKIILFVSAARDDMNRQSDADLLTDKKGAQVLCNLVARVYWRLRGGGVLGAIMVACGDVERHKDSHALVINPALLEGRGVYEAA